MTLLLSETQVESLLDMRDVVGAVEEAFRRQGNGEASNFMRTRSHGKGTVLNVMHASLPYLDRAGLKCYLSSPTGTRFMIVLFEASSATPLAIMGADFLGRFRTGAASGVATKHLYRGRSAEIAVFGSGRQALTQVMALGTVLSLEKVSVWSPDRSRRNAFTARLSSLGFNAVAAETPKEAAAAANVASTITSSAQPFLDAVDVKSVSHINVCGGNQPGHSELTAQAIGSFRTVVVDDLSQARLEYGDLINAASACEFAWEHAVSLGAVVAGKRAAEGRTLFKSGGVAIEDVAVASLVYEEAIRKGNVGAAEFRFADRT